MRNLLRQAVPLLVHFEHATVIVVGSQFLVEHLASFFTIGLTAVVFILFQVVKEAA
jgi:hypothetical protein